MANTITRKDTVDGSRNLVVDIHILGDGSGDESDTVLVDASDHNPRSTNIKIMKVKALFTGFSASFDWDATSNVPIPLAISDGEEVDADFTQAGGLINNAGTGRTGDILFSTSGLDSGDEGYIRFHLVKKNNQDSSSSSSVSSSSSSSSSSTSS